MAVTVIKNPSSLKLKFDLGMVDGKKKTRSKSFSHLRHDADLEDVYEIGTGLAFLQENVLVDITKADSTSVCA
ncbi:MAG: DUF1659 domain-containing protein [Paraclostridium sp.]